MAFTLHEILRPSAWSGPVGGDNNSGTFVAFGNPPKHMQRASHSIPLQHKNARTFCELRIFFDHGRGPNAAGDLVQQDTICRKLTKAMRREVNLATINERLHAC